MRAFRFSLLVMLVVALSASTVLAANEKPNVALNLTAQKEVVVKDADGKLRTEWREVKTTDPGDVLRYSIRYTNLGTSEARGTVINNPVPEGTAYVSGTAEGDGTEITYSIDGKNFQTPPLLKYRVKKPDGTEEELSATPEMYTHIRWKVTKPIPPGKSGIVSFQVKVK